MLLFQLPVKKVNLLGNLHINESKKSTEHLPSEPVMEVNLFHREGSLYIAGDH